MVYREICKKYKYKKKSWGAEYYANGASRCMGKCAIWLDWSGLFCPCCGFRLRKKTRHASQRLRRKIERDSKKIIV